MKKFAILAALVATSASFAVPASAASAVQLVRISLADKSTAQLDAEIKAAAQTVCATATSTDCVTGAISDANRQLSGIVKARGASKTAYRREALTIVRVSLKGKSASQIDADIKIAAETVCKAANRGVDRSNYRTCVGGAVRSAKAQLQAMTTSTKQDA
ncbi:hypothetical protein BH10PSE4_BH10PSE4_01320 [soil metagenome]